MRDRRITWGLEMLRPHGGGRLDGVAYLGQAEMLAVAGGAKEDGEGPRRADPSGGILMPTDKHYCGEGLLRNVDAPEPCGKPARFLLPSTERYGAVLFPNRMWLCAECWDWFQEALRLDAIPIPIGAFVLAAGMAGSSPPWFSRLHVPAAYLKSRNRKITNENYFPAAAELIRVCRPGGLIAMANWTPEGFVGKSFQVIAEMVPPPAGLPVPALWGNEQTVRQRFAKGISKLSLSRHKAVFDYPFSPKEVVDFFRQYFGPTQAAFSRLDKEGQSELAFRLESLWAEHNTATAGGTRIEAEYLDIRAIRS